MTTASIDWHSIVDRLIKKTQEETALWNATSVSDQYKLRLSDATIVLDKSSNPTQVWFRIEILNSQGVTIAGEQPEIFDELYNKLSDLFSMIEDKKLRMSETVRSIMKDLESDTVVGKKQPYDDDDKLPF